MRSSLQPPLVPSKLKEGPGSERDPLAAWLGIGVYGVGGELLGGLRPGRLPSFSEKEECSEIDMLRTFRLE